MYVVFLKYIFVENFNTSSRSHQPIPWNCNDKSLVAEGPRDRGPTYGAEGREKQIPIIKLSNNIYIHFALEKEVEKIVVLKKHAETLRSILNQ